MYNLYKHIISILILDMNVHFNTKINSIETYSPMEYDRSTLNFYVKHLINECYDYESMIVQIINCNSQYIVLTNYLGEYDIRITNFTKQWYEDDSTVTLFILLQQLNRVDDFIRCFDYHVYKNIKDDMVSPVEFKFYALHIKMDNICCMDE